MLKRFLFSTSTNQLISRSQELLLKKWKPSGHDRLSFFLRNMTWLLLGSNITVQYSTVQYSTVQLSPHLRHWSYLQAGQDLRSMWSTLQLPWNLHRASSSRCIISDFTDKPFFQIISHLFKKNSYLYLLIFSSYYFLIYWEPAWIN